MGSFFLAGIHISTLSFSLISHIRLKAPILPDVINMTLLPVNVMLGVRRASFFISGGNVALTAAVRIIKK